MLIDVHSHVGDCRTFDESITEETLLGQMDKYGVDVSLVQPFFGTIDMDAYREAHDRIHRMSKAYPKRIFGISAMNPHIRRDHYKDELRRCVEELGFVGVKLHPNAHGCSPDSKDGLYVAELAAELGIPVIVHTGAGIPMALPSNIIPAAMRFPEVKFVASHYGMLIGAGEALLAAKLCENIYMDTSWSVPHHILAFVEQVGSDRAMFSSDEPLNIGPEVVKLRDLPISEEDRENIASRTAIKLFRLEV